MPPLFDRQFKAQVLGRIDPVQFIGSDVKLKKQAKGHVGLCPFHTDSKPSFWVYPDGHYKCFGCQVHGDLFSYVMQQQDVDFPEACRQLAKIAGVPVPTRETTAEDKRKQAMFKVLGTAQHLYAEQLKRAPSAREYLSQRGLAENIVESYGLGYAPRSWNFIGTVTDHSEEALLQCGLVSKSRDGDRTYDFFRDRIVFPIRDYEGRVCGFGGRIMAEDSDQPKYLNSRENLVFRKSGMLYGLFELKQHRFRHDQVFLTEGYMDVIALGQHGINSAVAVLGTAANSRHFDTLFRHTKEVVLCLDGDEAGRTAAHRSMELALPSLREDRSIRFMFLPEGEDPDSLIRDRGKQGFLEAAQDAMPLVDYLYEQIQHGARLDSKKAQIDYMRKLNSLVSAVPDRITRNTLLDDIASHTPELSAQIRRVVGTSPVDSANDAEQTQSLEVKLDNAFADQSPAQRQLVAALVNCPAVWPALSESETVGSFEQHEPESFLTNLLQRIAEGGMADYETLLASYGQSQVAQQIDALRSNAKNLSVTSASLKNSLYVHITKRQREKNARAELETLRKTT